ncbi:MAG: PD40 domain-containing protein [Verrucomicrobiales bacterium]|nr:PD40 domain-containing protein [Verrucomicrobiales bacterium]
MPLIVSRRRFLALAAVSGASLSAGCQGHMNRLAGPKRRFFFTSQGRTAMMNSDGTSLRYLEFQVPNQATWQPGPFLSDGRRVILLSMEPRRDGPGKPFEEYYTQTPTHLWIYDLEKGSYQEIAHRDRMAVFYTPALLVSDQRILVQVVKNKVGQIYSMNLDGTDARPFTRAGEGLPYGLSLSPDGQRVAFHLASPQGYQVWTSRVDGTDRVRVAAHPDHLYFGTSWSPDGRWILYHDCHHRQDPGHDWSDVCVGRPDGSEHRVLSQGQPQWFAATYGSKDRKGGGSNMPGWSSDGQILFSRRAPGAKVPWEYQVGRPDTDHFNREFKPELSRGGTQIVRLNPDTGQVAELTSAEPAVWDFRMSESSDGKEIVFCRARTGESPAIWVMDRDGARQRRLTAGFEDQGADHPRWLPVIA